MRKLKNAIFAYRSIIILSLTLLIIVSGCDLNIVENYMYPNTEILKLYLSPKFDSYRINTVAVAPMMNDDTTEVGTFYSTNHLLNQLEDTYTGIDFFIPSDSISADPDSLTVWLAESIEKEKHLDLESFFSTDLGTEVQSENADAIFIGVVNSYENNHGLSFSRSKLKVYNATLTSCEFTYYLISLKDGRVLWRARVKGEEGFFLNMDQSLFPELDYAISNGIDKMFDVLPFKKK